jgi:hypothetical protein
MGFEFSPSYSYPPVGGVPQSRGEHGTPTQLVSKGPFQKVKRAPNSMRRAASAEMD